MQRALFASQLNKLQQDLPLKDPLYRLKLESWNQFLSVGLPDKKSESYQYVKLRKLFSKELILPEKEALDPSPWIFPECKNSCLVFVNGVYSPEISKLPEGLEILPLSEAIFTYTTYLKNQAARTAEEEKDPFALLNGALYSEGVMIHLAQKASPDYPLQFLFINQQSDRLSQPKIELFLGKESTLKVVSRHINLKPNCFTNAFTNCVLNEASKLTYIQTAIDLENGWLFDAIRAHLKRDSNFTTIMSTCGSENVRYDYQVELAGENCDAHLNGLWMLNDNKEAHVHVLMKHTAPYARSLQLFKGTLNDQSRSSFEGKIFVAKEAQKSDSFQLNNNLLLSDKAQANSKPNLEIFADDVKASHGSTVGPLPQDEIFYLKARGFNEKEATALLTKAFLREVIDKIDLPSLRNELIEKSKNFLSPVLTEAL